MNGRKVLLVSILCLFGFCLAAQSQSDKNRSQDTKTSKVYLLHSNLLKKSKNLPDVQVLVGDVVYVTIAFICIATVPISMKRRICWKHSAM